MTLRPPAWPRTTGASLLLVPIDRDEDWSRAEQVVRAAIDGLDVAVAGKK